MEIIIAIALVATIFVLYRVFTHQDKDDNRPVGSDATAPYKVEPPETTTKLDETDHANIPVLPTLTNVLDVNNDGKVNLEDAKEAVRKTKATVEEAAQEVVEKVKKPRGRKPKAE